MAMHALYLADVSPSCAQDAFSLAISTQDEGGMDEKTLDFSRGLFEGARGHLADLDKRIQETATNWSLERMAAVDRNILRLAAFELLHQKDTPPKVVIDESLEIARKYSTEDSTRFINGVLDKLKDSA
jgi:transcription antitermination protein NusB